MSWLTLHFFKIKFLNVKIFTLLNFTKKKKKAFKKKKKEIKLIIIFPNRKKSAIQKEKETDLVKSISL